MMRHSAHAIQRVIGVLTVLALVAPVDTIAAQDSSAAGSRWPAAPRPKAPIIIHRACPFECCQYGRWTLREPAVVRERPTRNARVLFRPRTGVRLFADTGFVRIESVGLVVLRTDHVDRMNGVRYVAGDSLLVLDYLGEGVHNGWLRGRAVQTEIFWLPEDPLRPREMPGQLMRNVSAQWWARVRDARGRRGWVDMSRTAVSGADACGG
jgi:hypothetical protein